VLASHGGRGQLAQVPSEQGYAVRDRTIGLVWGVGLIVAVLVYAIGPDQFLRTLFIDADRLADALQDALQSLGARAYDLVRAAAIACFTVFFGLSVVAAGRGLPARWLLVGVTLLFLMLVWNEGPEATGHWLLAFMLAAAGAASMTRRLTAPRMMLPPGGEERF
jgi:hypothetical protein